MRKESVSLAAVLLIVGCMAQQHEGPPQLDTTSGASAPGGAVSGTAGPNVDGTMSTNGSKDRPTAQPNQPSLKSVSFACPPDASTRRTVDVCVGTLSSPTSSFGEPFVGIDPRNPNRIALGVNAVSVANDHRDAPANNNHIDVFVSETGGATWQVTHVSLGPSAASSDPALAFDQQGVLHLTGIRIQSDLSRLGGGYLDLFYMRSADAGRTWASPVYFPGDRAQDRNWLSVDENGSLFVAWQNFLMGSSEVAWSRDAGMTWQRMPSRVEGCARSSPVLPTTQGPLLACSSVSRAGNCGSRIELHRLNLASGTTSLVSVVEDEAFVCPYRLLLTQDARGTVFLAFSDASTYLVASLDGGVTWAKPLDLRGLLFVGAKWDWIVATWMAADTWGGLHLVVEGGMGSVCPRPCPSEEAWGHRTGHALLAGQSLTVLKETLLTPEDATQRTRSPPSLATQIADDFHGMAFSADAGFLAWTLDKGIDYSVLMPEFRE